MFWVQLFILLNSLCSSVSTSLSSTLMVPTLWPVFGSKKNLISEESPYFTMSPSCATLSISIESSLSFSKASALVFASFVLFIVAKRTCDSLFKKYKFFWSLFKEEIKILFWFPITALEVKLLTAIAAASWASFCSSSINWSCKFENILSIVSWLGNGSPDAFCSSLTLFSTCFLNAGLSAKLVKFFWSSSISTSSKKASWVIVFVLLQGVSSLSGKNIFI